jgi:hypothetical protein
MRFSPIFVPFAVFFLLFLAAASRALRFFWKVRASVSDGQFGKAVHLETPLGAIDLRPQQGPDSDLASIPKYPGAVPVRELTSPSYEVDIHAPGHTGRYASETFRTDDQAGMVLDFYKRELPDWQQDRFYQHGFRLIHENAGCQRAISIRRQNDQTAIEYAVVHPEQDVSSSGTIPGSDSNFGVLR